MLFFDFANDQVTIVEASSREEVTAARVEREAQVETSTGLTPVPT
jgi:hypothetical protein